MKIKLDENLGRRIEELFQAAGHDVATVYSEGLSSAADGLVIDAARQEGRCLVTLDLEFGNPLLFRAADYEAWLCCVFRQGPPTTTWRCLRDRLDVGA